MQGETTPVTVTAFCAVAAIPRKMAMYRARERIRVLMGFDFQVSTSYTQISWQWLGEHDEIYVPKDAG